MQATYGDLKAECCRLLKVEEVDVQLWEYWQQEKTKNLEDPPDNIDKAVSLPNNCDLLLLGKAGHLLP